MTFEIYTLLPFLFIFCSADSSVYKRPNICAAQSSVVLHLYIFIYILGLSDEQIQFVMLFALRRQIPAVMRFLSILCTDCVPVTRGLLNTLINILNSSSLLASWIKWQGLCREEKIPFCHNAVSPFSPLFGYLFIYFKLALNWRWKTYSMNSVRHDKHSGFYF